MKENGYYQELLVIAKNRLILLKELCRAGKVSVKTYKVTAYRTKKHMLSGDSRGLLRGIHELVTQCGGDPKVSL